MEVRIPVNTTAVIHVPLGPKGVVRESGKRLSDAPAIGRLGARARAAIVSVGSGSYSFVSE
jgi:alpha-L-rhamnosidase